MRVDNLGGGIVVVAAVEKVSEGDTLAERLEVAGRLGRDHFVGCHAVAVVIVKNAIEGVMIVVVVVFGVVVVVFDVVVVVFDVVVDGFFQSDVVLQQIVVPFVPLIPIHQSIQRLLASHVCSQGGRAISIIMNG